MRARVVALGYRGAGAVAAEDWVVAVPLGGGAGLDVAAGLVAEGGGGGGGAAPTFFLAQAEASREIAATAIKVRLGAWIMLVLSYLRLNPFGGANKILSAPDFYQAFLQLHSR